RFTGTPEQVVRFFTAVAGEVREILALMGFRRLEDIVGRTDLLEARIPSGGRAAGLSLSRIIASPSASAEGRRCGQPRNDPPPTGGHLDEAVLARRRYRTGGPRATRAAAAARRSSRETRCCMARPEDGRSSPAGWASASRSATAAAWPSSRAPGTTPAST